jgi:hypothetical protein
VGFVGAVGILAVMTDRAGQRVHPGDLAWWPLPLAFACACAWWLLLARGWSLLVSGRTTLGDLSTWSRTQAMRYLPGGIWAPASRATVVRGSLLRKLSTVAAENILALCAALALGGLGLALGGDPWWLPLVLAIVGPVLVARLARTRSTVAAARTIGAIPNYVVASVGYAGAAVLTQAAVSGLHHPLAVAGAGCVAWGFGLIVVIAPSGVGAREVAYIWLLSGRFPSAQLTAAAVTMRLVMILAELVVLLAIGRPTRQREQVPAGSPHE